MNKLISVYLILIIFSKLISMDTAYVDQKTLSIPEREINSPENLSNAIRSRFSSKEEYQRALYTWIAKNIAYDYEKLNIRNAPESEEIIIKSTFSTRKAVCQGYSEVFTKTARLLGLDAYTIVGYSRQEDGVSEIAHGWNAVKEPNGRWYLYDCTWGAGHMVNDKYIKTLSYEYYRQPPEDFIKTHMPFDPLWQFLTSPISNKDFYQGHFEVKKVGNFAFNDSIKVYLNQNERDQLLSTLRRVKNRGIVNKPIADFISITDYNAQVHEYNQSVQKHNDQASVINEAVKQFNYAVDRFNAYLKIRNSNFNNGKSFNQALDILYETKNSLNTTVNTLKSFKSSEPGLQARKEDLLQSVQDFFKTNDNEIQYVLQRKKKGK